MGDVYIESSDYVEDGVVGLRSMLRDGCRPTRLVLYFEWITNLPYGTPTADYGLRVMAELRAVSPPSLTAVKLVRLSLTAAVVRAIGLVAPRLSDLALQGYNLSHCTGLQDSLPFRPTLSGVQGLLRLAAPHLRRLSLTLLEGPMHESALAAAAYDLASPLLRCSRLTELSLQSSYPRPLSVLSGLSVIEQLPGLRSLKVDLPNLESEPPRVLPSLTQLTRLVLRDGATYELASVLSAVSGMRGLADLQLDSHKLRPAHMHQLVDLTALTRLHIAGIWVADEAAPAGGGAEVAAGVPGPAAQPVVPRVPLPAQLQVLVLTQAPSLSEATALGLPAGPPRLQLPGIRVAADDMDADGRLSSSAAAALLAACEQLRGRLCRCDKASRLDAGQGFELPFTLDLGHAAAPAGWPDQYGTLFAALQPLYLWDLTVHCARLTVMEVHALVRHLPLLQALCFERCALELPAVPLLSHLRRLVVLHLHPGGGGLVEGWDNEFALKAVLLVLCTDAPSLRAVSLWCPEPVGNNVWFPTVEEKMRAAAQRAVDWLEVQLRGLCEHPPDVCLH